MINNLYTYKAIVNRVVDGDTLNLTIDLGFNTYWKSNCRFAGINTPELKAVDETIRANALKAKQYVESKVPIGSEVLIVSKSLDKYGRPIVEVYYGTDFKEHLNTELLNEGLAVVLKY
jgi:micrococcal nuclease